MYQRALFLLPLIATTTAAQPANPFAGDALATGVGKGIFRIYCAPCHGIHGQGGRGPDLTRGVYNAEHDSDLYHTISAGVAGTEMESYAGLFSDDTIWRLVTYIRSLNKSTTAAPASGDATRGSELFWGKGRCGTCHMVDAKGGRSGPNLSRAGRQRSVAYLRDSIVAPSADITPGYTAVSVGLRDGRTILGFERGLDNFTVQVMDLAGNFYSFEKSGVNSVKRETRSLMPDNYGKLLTQAQVDDIVSYLASLRGEAAKP